MQEIRTKIEEVEMELADLYWMSEDAACFRYNTIAKRRPLTSSMPNSQTSTRC